MDLTDTAHVPQCVAFPSGLARGAKSPAGRHLGQRRRQVANGADIGRPRAGDLVPRSLARADAVATRRGGPSPDVRKPGQTNVFRARFREAGRGEIADPKVPTVVPRGADIGAVQFALLCITLHRFAPKVACWRSRQLWTSSGDIAACRCGAAS